MKNPFTPPTRLARINFPVATNEGRDLTAEAETFRLLICDYFGGFTEYAAKGGWKDGDKLYLEPMRVFEIAMPDTQENAAHLVDLALWTGSAARQQAVYIVGADGKAQIIETAHLWNEPSEAAA